MKSKFIVIMSIVVTILICFIIFSISKSHALNEQIKELDKYSLEKVKTENELISLKNQVQSLKKDNEDVELLLKHSEEKIDELNLELENKLNERNLNDDLKTKYEQLQKDYDSLKSENENIQKEINNLKAQQTSTKTTPPKQEVKTEEKIAYLTFDDGPSSNTIKVLDILKKNNIKATFFVNGRTDEQSIAIYKRIIAEGHAIGNHTYSHDYSTIYKSAESFEKDFNQLNDLLKEYGITTNIMRYPGGSNNHVSYNYGGKEVMYDIVRHMNSKGYTFFDWNVDSGDASAALVNSSQLIKNVQNGSANKNEIVILMHDTKAKTTTVDALPTIIQNLKNDGFSFKSLNKDSYKPQFLKY